MRFLVFFFIMMNILSCKREQTGDRLDVVVTYYPDSTLKEVVQKRNGVLEGKAFKFDEFGAKVFEFNYQDDLREGMQYYYYDGGRLNFAVPFRAGKENGWAVRYTGRCGSVSEEGQFLDGRQDGIWVAYYDNELLEVLKYRRDTLVEVVYRNPKFPDRTQFLPSVPDECVERNRGPL